jgi:hypothetical protein
MKIDAMGPWDIWKVRGRLTEVWSRSDGTVVLLGIPDHEDAEELAHNCDANGCGQDHVLWRGRVEPARAKESR